MKEFSKTLKIEIGVYQINLKVLTVLSTQAIEFEHHLFTDCGKLANSITELELHFEKCD